jgi:HPt (histidine-containing phosphotransfer) domain-containing protein
LRGRRGSLPFAEESSVDGETVLDPSTLRDDYLILGAERTGRMVEAFCGATPGQVAELAEAVDGRDWDRVGYLAHTLKGGAGSLGLLALESRSHALEAAANACDADAVAKAHGDFQEIHSRSLKALGAAWLGFVRAGRSQVNAPSSAVKK